MPVLLFICAPLLVWPFTLFRECDWNNTSSPKINHCVKCPNTEFSLVCIFPHSDWIRRYTPYLSVFSPNAGKYGPEKTPYLDTFHAVNLAFAIITILVKHWKWFDFTLLVLWCVSNDEICTSYHNGVVSTMPHISGTWGFTRVGGASKQIKEEEGLTKIQIQMGT